MTEDLDRVTKLLDRVSERLKTCEAWLKEIQENLEAVEKWQEQNAPVLQQVRARWHLPGPRCAMHGKRNCSICFERGL
jgi:hypothetical protein